MNNILLRRRIMLGLASSPFSPEATAILKEDFPDEWDTIKAYGYANREMVPYINEDPDFIVSLGLVDDVTRWLVGKNLAYIDLRCVGNLNTDAEYVAKLQSENTSKVLSLFGNSNTATESISTLLPTMNSTVSSRTLRFDNVSVANKTKVNQLNPNKFNINKNGLKINDNFIVQFTNPTTFNTNGNLLLYKIAGIGNDGTYNNTDQYISYFKLDGDYKREMYPFIRNNVKGMIDILSNTFYPNANSVGEFTIKYTGRPYLNITSTTKTYIINTYGESAWNTVKEFFTDPTTESLIAAVNSDPTIVEELCGINGGELRSLKANGMPYINTSYVVGQYDSIETEFYYTKQNTEQSQYVFGAMDSGFGENGTFIALGTNSLIRAFFGGNRLGGAGYSYDIGDTNRHLFKYIGNKDIIQLYKDSILAVETDIESSTFTSNTLTIFSHNRTGQPTESYVFNTGSIKYLRIKKNGVYSMYLIPRTVNNNVGFLDVVSNAMLYNSNNTGSLSIVTEQ